MTAGLPEAPLYLFDVMPLPEVSRLVCDESAVLYSVKVVVRLALVGVDTGAYSVMPVSPRIVGFDEEQLVAGDVYRCDGVLGYRSYVMDAFVSLS